MKKSALNSPRYGFTLIELSMVLLIIAVIVGMSASMGKHMIASAQRTATSNKLDQIEASLMAFRVANNRLPCPADMSLPDSDPNFGVEAVNAGNCTAGATYNAGGIRTAPSVSGPTANSIDGTHNVVEGGVPFQALGLSKEFAVDGWKHRIAYAVNYNVTGLQAMLGQALTEKCNITVKSASANATSRTTGALYALVSYGADGHGSYLSTGARNNAGSTNTDELANCHCTNAAAAAVTGYSANYVMKDHTENPASATDMFDDLVRYKERWQMQTYDDGNKSGAPVCSSGFRIDAYKPGAPGAIAGFVNAVGNFTGHTDGTMDMAIGDINGVYIIVGTANGFPDPLPLIIGQYPIDGTNGVYLNWNGYAPTNLLFGNFSGHTDGTKDLAFMDNGGTIHIIFGHPMPWPTASVDISGYMDGVRGFQIIVPSGSAWYYTCPSMAAGNVSGHGDGTDDLIIGNPGVCTQTATSQLWAYFGHRAPWPNVNSLPADGINGVNYTSANGFFGYYVAVGDYNGDSIKDIFVTDGPDFLGPPSSLDVVFGRNRNNRPWPATGDITTVTGNGVDGFQVVSNDNHDNGSLFRTASGDVNGDGYSDIIAGSLYNNQSISIIFGKPCGLSAGPCSPNPLNINQQLGIPTNNIVTNGNNYDGTIITSSQPFGGLVSAGDVNGDGIDDILTYMDLSSTEDLIFGHAATPSNPWPATIDIEPNSPFFDGINGIQITSINNYSIASTAHPFVIGNINGGPYNDIIMGQPNANFSGAGAQSGSIYVLYGRKKGSWPSLLIDAGSL